jgi:hypothetical protein
MQGPAWVSLLRRIPADQQDCVVLVTTTRAQIVLQRLLRLENDFLVGIGRLAGSTDQGQVVVIPYDQLTYLSFSKQLAEKEIETILGKPGAVASEKIAPQPASVGEPDSSIEEQPQESTGPNLLASITPSAETKSPTNNADQEVAKPNPKAPMPSKSIFLARLRQRLADSAAKDPKP